VKEVESNERSHEAVLKGTFRLTFIVNVNLKRKGEKLKKNMTLEEKNVL